MTPPAKELNTLPTSNYLCNGDISFAIRRCHSTLNEWSFQGQNRKGLKSRKKAGKTLNGNLVEPGEKLRARNLVVFRPDKQLLSHDMTHGTQMEA